MKQNHLVSRDVVNLVKKWNFQKGCRHFKYFLWSDKNFQKIVNVLAGHNFQTLLMKTNIVKIIKNLLQMTPKKRLL